MTIRRLVWRNLTRHPVRALLVFTFAALSLFVFGFLRSVVTSLDAAVAHAGSQRLVVSSSVSLFSELPDAYRQTLAETDGVESVSRWSWFGGYFRDPKNTFPTLAVDLEVLFRQFPELVLPEDQRRAILSDRRACVVGAATAEKYGFEVGDTIPMVGTFYPLSGGRPWEFTVRGIYRSEDPALIERVLFFHWDYLDEVRRTLPEREGSASSVSLYRIRLVPGAREQDVVAAVERRYENGPQRVRAQTESGFRAERIAAIGDVPTLLGWIGGAVFLAMIFSVVNAMSITASERAREVGILKALGFRDGTAARLVVWESLALVGSGGCVGVLASYLTMPVQRRAFAEMMPNFFVAPVTVAAGIAISLAIGLLGGLAPAWRLARLRPIAVLREEA